VVYTTHYMEEVERLCDRIVIVDHGRVLADNTLEALLASAPVGNKLTLKYDGAPDSAALAEIRSLPGVIQVDLAGAEVSVSANDLGTAAPRVLERLAARGFSCQELTSRRVNLEDVFLGLTGRTLRDT
jgi:ABC-2 type transport system ATP-binding protein